ncbi:recombinase family protein [Afipia clevelandensis]
MLTQLKLSGMSAAKIACELTARQVPTERGGRWHAQTVIRLLEKID